MEHVEYLVQQRPSFSGDIQPWLTTLGEDGWKLIQIDSGLVYFMRVKSS